MRHFLFIHRGESGAGEIAVALDGSRCLVRVGGVEESAEAVRLPDGRLSLVFADGRQLSGRVAPRPNGEVEVSTGSGCRRIALAEPLQDRIAHASGTAAAGGGDEVIRALMPGRVVEVAVQAGEDVEKGALLLVLEAMKMQNEIRSTRVGRVLRVDVEAGRPVESGARLVVLGSRGA